MKFKLPTTVTDPSELTGIGTFDAWFGTSFNDKLIYRGGNDSIDGRKGVDTLVLSQFRSDVKIGTCRSGAFLVGIENPLFDPNDIINNERFDNTITAVGIERVQLFDKTIDVKRLAARRKGEAARAQRREMVAADPRADAALARLPLSVSVSPGEKDPASIESNTPFCSVAADLF
ncbi:MAG: hypothetical protein ACKOXO_00540 [Cyanobium sp.]